MLFQEIEFKLFYKLIFKKLILKKANQQMKVSNSQKINRLMILVINKFHNHQIKI
jgi:hypothetical protein